MNDIGTMKYDNQGGPGGGIMGMNDVGTMKYDFQGGPGGFPGVLSATNGAAFLLLFV